MWLLKAFKEGFLELSQAVIAAVMIIFAMAFLVLVMVGPILIADHLQSKLWFLLYIIYIPIIGALKRS